MRFLNKTMYRVLLTLFGLALLFMALEPFTDTGFVEPLSVVILAIFLFHLLRWLYRFFDKMEKKRLKLLVIILFLVFIGLQIFSVNIAHLMVFGDPWHIQMQAMRMSQGDFNYDVWINQYPNIMPMVALNFGFIKLSSLLHISYYAVFYTFNILVTTSIWVLLITFLWKKRANLAALMSVIMIVFPMNYDFLLRIGYSDGLTILALLALVIIFEKARKKGHFSWLQALGTLLAFSVAYLARPNVIVLLIALLIFGAVGYHRRKKLGNFWKICFKILMTCILGILLASAGNKAINSSLGYDANNPSAFPTVNWIYESVNYESKGQWTPADRDYTLFHNGYATASEADIEGIKSRLLDMLKKPWRFVILYVTKFAQLWSCGTFATGTDYQLYGFVYEWTHAPAFLIQNIGAINLFMETFAKVLMSVFLFAIVMVLWRKKKVEPSIFGLSILTIMGISLFHTLIWEVKPRYQFMTISLILLVAALSFEHIFAKDFVWKKSDIPDKTAEKKGLAHLVRSSFFNRLEVWFIKHKKKFLVILPLLSLVSIILMSTVMQFQMKQRVVVNAQQHEVDHFGYSNGTYTLLPSQSISQEVKLPVPADRIELIAESTQEVQLILSEKTSTGWKTVHTQKIVENKKLAVINHSLAAGIYRITIKNEGSRGTSFPVMRDMRTTDIPNPIKLPDGEEGSFGYIISQSQKVTKVPVGLIGTYAFIFIIGNIILLRRNK